MENKEIVVLTKPDLRRVEIKIVGTAPLICHKWSEKAKKEIRDKQTQKAKIGRELKNPEEEFKNSLYSLDNEIYGFPSIAFKAAIVRAGTYVDMKMTYLRGAFHIEGEFVVIDGIPSMREDMVKVGMGVADIRYRGEFKRWNATLPIIYNARAISVEQITNLLMIAGFSVGVGEWRPERDGQFGTFSLEKDS